MLRVGDLFRVVHWNVRRCVDVSGACSRARIVRSLEELQPGLVTLNEVDMLQTPSLLEDLSALGLQHASFFGHVRGVYGNLLASTEPLEEITHLHLDGGTKVETKDGRVHRIARGLLSTRISVLGVGVRVAVTHLDHISSVERRVQMQHALRALKAETEQCLVVGDLNALCRRDYTVAEWGEHEQYNLAQGWDQPVDECGEGGVLALLRGAAFVDAFAALEQPPHWSAAPWSAHVRDRSRPPYRIDFIFSRVPTAGRETRLVPRAGCVAHNCAEASDHQPIVVDFGAIGPDATT